PRTQPPKPRKTPSATGPLPTSSLDGARGRLAADQNRTSEDRHHRADDHVRFAKRTRLERSKEPLSDLAGPAQPHRGSSILVERAALAVVRDPKVEIVVPVYNEERDLERSVRRLRAHRAARSPFHALLTIAD